MKSNAEKNIRDLLKEIKQGPLPSPKYPKKVELQIEEQKQPKGFSKKIAQLINEEQVFSKFEYEKTQKSKKVEKMLDIMRRRVAVDVFNKKSRNIAQKNKTNIATLISHKAKNKDFNEYGSNRNMRENKSKFNDDYNSLRSSLLHLFLF